MPNAFGPAIWLVDGPAVTGAVGFRFPTRMAIIRLKDGSLFLWSPVRLTDALGAAVAALGPVRHLVAPNDLHHMALGDWAAAFPEALVHGAPGLRKKRPELEVDVELGAAARDAWIGQIDQALFSGNWITTEVVFFHRASKTAIFTDLLQQMPPDWHSGWRGVIARLNLMTGEAPQVPRKFRLAFRDRAALRERLDQVLGWSAERLVMAHGPPAEKGGGDLIRNAFDWA